MVIDQFRYLADSRIISSGHRIRAALTTESIRISAPQGPSGSLSSNQSFGETLVNLLAAKPPRWACPRPGRCVPIWQLQLALAAWRASPLQEVAVLTDRAAIL
jgi:hypothetical protein